jgi:hypothetical protein
VKNPLRLFPLLLLWFDRGSLVVGRSASTACEGTARLGLFERGGGVGGSEVWRVPGSGLGTRDSFGNSLSPRPRPLPPPPLFLSLALLLIPHGLGWIKYTPRDDGSRTHDFLGKKEEEKSKMKESSASEHVQRNGMQCDAIRT